MSEDGLLRRNMLRSLDYVERVGNRLPDPVTIFILFSFLVLGVSWAAAVLGVRATHPGTGEDVTAINLLTRENVQRMLVEMPRTFTDFPPLGIVLLVMLGIGVAERTGLIETVLKVSVRSMPPRFITGAIVLAGILSSIGVIAGYVVVLPLGALVFHGIGRHPIAGLAAAFAGVSAGLTANLFLTPLDPLLTSFTQPAARLLDPEYVVDPTANYWLMMALVPVFTVAGIYVTENVLEPHLGPYEGKVVLEEGEEDTLTPEERKGLWTAAVVALLTLAVVALMVVPENGILRGDNGEITPFLSSIVSLMLFVFLLPGLAYGMVTRKIKSDRDVARMTADAMASMGHYIVLAFVAAHFIAFFAWSNLGLILAITGADLLRAVGFTGIPLFVSFVFVSAFINLFIASMSAKWAIMSPIFVPMFMLLGYSPELTQAAYRIGDSFTNILTPLLPYYPLVITFARKYEEDIRIGTLLSAMLPYSLAYGALGIGMVVLWMAFGFPLGPDVSMYYRP